MKIRSLRMLKHFLTASRMKNFRQAAISEAISQSALTKSIQQLEDILGAQLFDRTTKGVSLTREGWALYSRANRIEIECLLLERELNELSDNDDGSLTIGAGSVWSSVFLPHILTSLHQKRPSAQFTVIRSSGTQFIKQFENKEIDVGFGALDSIIEDADKQSNEFIYKPLFHINTAFYVNKNHPLCSMKSVTAEDICQFPFAVFRPDIQMQNQVKRFFTLKGVAQLEATIMLDSISGVLETLKMSSMVSCFPEQLATIAASFGVVPLNIGESPWRFQTGVVYRESFIGYPLLDDLLEQLSQYAS